MKKDKLDWLCGDEDVQFIWCLRKCPPTTLRDIVYVWVSTLAHSKVQKLKEDHKKAKAQGVKWK